MAGAKGDQCETTILQMCDSFFQVIRKPQIVVRHVSNVGSGRLSEKIVAQAVAESRSLWKPIETDPRIVKTPDDRLCFVARAVAEDV